MSQNYIQIGLVDDHMMFRDGLSSIFNNQDNYQVILEAENGESCLSQLDIMPVLPQFLLVDVEMPRMNGYDLLVLLKEKYKSIKVIMITSHNDNSIMDEFISAGAAGFLSKDYSSKRLIKEMESLIYTYIPKEQDIEMNHVYKSLNDLYIQLTKRELEVLCELCNRKTPIEIAQKLSINIQKFELVKRNLFLKTGAQNETGLILFAINNKLL